MEYQPLVQSEIGGPWRPPMGPSFLDFPFERASLSASPSDDGKSSIIRLDLPNPETGPEGPYTVKFKGPLCPPGILSGDEKTRSDWAYDQYMADMTVRRPIAADHIDS
jgi:hypothetical protein